MRRPYRAACTAPLLLFMACAYGAGGAPLSSGLEDAVLFTGAGDIAVCGSAGDDSTAALLDRIPGVIWTTGDNVYPAGTPEDFARCYAPTWGRHRPRTRPTPGNHEYWTPGATGYFDYFGTAAGPAGKGWYSYRYGRWLVVALNSNLNTSPGSEQVRWLRRLLASNPSRCTVAYFHHPLYSSGAHGANAADEHDANVRPIWEALYSAGVEVVLNGHDHHYERFAPMTPAGARDPARGIRQFIVGTGGGALRGRRGDPHTASEVFLEGHHGVLRLTLGARGYAWAFFDVEGRIRDSGRDRCH